ncbi:hypothetical protein DQ04_03291010 [Trypanosoma grayi]|uniref:hypothetical protein n=1 Tax=Trypanosoma grayi TaxID=71804 RepID=UPI0004F43416|nr:hypothetical protein DQ04_03291010 [Trypanosoma grayi]KEG10784.1 hypothetical protein DQ04_03291010 [Trypanosoma grayi]
MELRPINNNNNNNNAAINGRNSGINNIGCSFSLASPSHHTPQRLTRSWACPSSAGNETVTDIYANDMAYLQTLDKAQAPEFAPVMTRMELDGALAHPDSTSAVPPPLVTHLRKTISDYMEENATLRQKKKEHGAAGAPLHGEGPHAGAAGGADGEHEVSHAGGAEFVS